MNTAYFTWVGSALSGQVQSEEHSWSLEGCGENCYSWVKQDRSSWLIETYESPPPTRNRVNNKKLNDLKVQYDCKTHF